MEAADGEVLSLLASLLWHRAKRAVSENSTVGDPAAGDPAVGEDSAIDSAVER